MKVDLWIDVRCPWTWMMSRWIAEDIVPARDIEISWNPMSLFLVHDPPPDTPPYEKLWFTHRLLRVIEAVREGEGEESAGRVYFECARRVWHDRDWNFDPAEPLAVAGVSTAYATAFSEESWDEPIRASMARGYALIGEGAGNTPILGVTRPDGKAMALYGPELVRRPDPDRSLDLWDALVELVTNDAFAVVGRETPELPDFGPRPETLS